MTAQSRQRRPRTTCGSRSSARSLKAPAGRRRSAGLQRPHHHPRPEERPAAHDAGGDHRRLRAGAGSGPRGATSTGCATCARPAARRSPCRGRKEDVSATELDPTQRVAFFRDVLGPVAEAIPFGVRFIRTRRRRRSRPSAGGGRGPTRSSSSTPTAMKAVTEQGPEGPAVWWSDDGGRYWIRTSDLTDVNRAL